MLIPIKKFGIVNDFENIWTFQFVYCEQFRKHEKNSLIAIFNCRNNICDGTTQVAEKEV
jgi:hypothetical protein